MNNQNLSPRANAEGTFIWRDQQIQDVYVRYQDEGILTLHIRVTVDLPINVMVAWVAEYMAQKTRDGGCTRSLGCCA